MTSAVFGDLRPPRRAARGVLLLAMLLAHLAPAQAWVLSRHVVRDSGTTRTLVLEQGATWIQARVDGAGPAWRLVVDASGPRLGNASLDSAPCSLLHVTVWTHDAGGDGVLNGDAGDALWLFVAATAGIDQPRSWLAGVELRGTAARVAWSVDASALPALGTLATAPTVVMGSPGPRLPPRPLLVLGTGWPADPGANPRQGRGGLLVLDALTGRALPGAPTFDAAVPGGVTAVDLDADGAHDRLYATDATGRLWRVDLPATAGVGEVGDWRAHLLADLGAAVDTTQGFVFAPDVALLEFAPGAAPALAITVGTSDRDAPSASPHWLFQVRDTAGREPAPPPVHADDLPIAEDAPAPGGRGFRRRLPGPLASAPLTLAGQLKVTTLADPRARCTVDTEPPSRTVDVHTLSAHTGQPGPPMPVVRVTAPAGAPLTAGWSNVEGLPSDTLACRVGDVDVPGCPKVPRLTRRWWLRRDAP